MGIDSALRNKPNPDTHGEAGGGGIPARNCCCGRKRRRKTRSAAAERCWANNETLKNRAKIQTVEQPRCHRIRTAKHQPCAWFRLMCRPASPRRQNKKHCCLSAGLTPTHTHAHLDVVLREVAHQPVQKPVHGRLRSAVCPKRPQTGKRHHSKSGSRGCVAASFVLASFAVISHLCFQPTSPYLHAAHTYVDELRHAAAHRYFGVPPETDRHLHGKLLCERRIWGLSFYCLRIGGTSPHGISFDASRLPLPPHRLGARQWFRIQHVLTCGMRLRGDDGALRGDVHDLPVLLLDHTLQTNLS